MGGSAAVQFCDRLKIWREVMEEPTRGLSRMVLMDSLLLVEEVSKTF